MRERGRHLTRDDRQDGSRDGPGLVVWALEPYFGGSHKAFLQGLAHNSSHDFTLFTLPGRHWKWRMHGGALSLARQAATEAAMSGPPHVFFASDMLDLPVFLAAAGGHLRPLPAILYFHENQLTYPLPPGVTRDLGYGFKNLMGATVAETVLFNSRYHMLEFLSAAQDLLHAMPDEVPAGMVAEIEAKARVLPVGCDLRRLERYRRQATADMDAKRWGNPGDGPLLLWNQRWEYDKAPRDLFSALYDLQGAGVAFRLAVAGSHRDDPPVEFREAKARLGRRIVQWGKVVSDTEYASLLWAADVVVSTAVHEFFGIAVVEAVYCGCRPVLPRRLSYPEIIPPEAHGEVLYGEGELVTALTRALSRPRAWCGDWQRTWVSRFDWGSLRNRYDDEIRRCWENATRMRGSRTLVR